MARGGVIRLEVEEKALAPEPERLVPGTIGHRWTRRDSGLRCAKSRSWFSTRAKAVDLDLSAAAGEAELRRLITDAIEPVALADPVSDG